MVEYIFRLLDKLAGRWLDWHTDYAMRHNPEIQKMLDEFGLKKLDIQPGEIGVTFITPAATMLAESMAEMLDKAHAENYIQMDMLPRLDRQMRPIRLTVQWADGESPAAQNARLRDEIARLTKDC